MNRESEAIMNVEQFVRLYPQRAPQIMWFLGAGASAAAGVPTAGQLVWDLKCQLYCAAQRASVAICSDLTNPLVQVRIQQYFDDAGGFPALWDDDEYAFYFERAYPDEADRRSYIEQKVRGATPSYGHIALAALLKMGKAHVVWSTNFDRTIEDAVAKLFGGTTALVVVSLGEPRIALEALNAGRWPLLGKLHGDFQSRRLKNTSEELQAQDAELRRALTEACRRYGLAIVGYSGRDESVMETLRLAMGDERAFPAGLFWFHRAGSSPSPSVTELINDAQSKGIGAYLVEVETFDELMSDVMRLIPNVPSDIEDQLDKRALRVSPAPTLRGAQQWPVIRLNALPVTSSPTICRRFTCDIGGSGEVRAAVATAEAKVVAARRNVGVLAFGSDSEVRKAFGNYNIQSWDVHAIETSRLRYESQEKGLLYDALVCALGRERPVAIARRHGDYYALVDRAQQSHELLSTLAAPIGSLTGTVPSTTVAWAEAVRIRLDFKLDQLWLVLEPTVWIERTEDEEHEAAAKEFQRERLARRYNAEWNAVLEGWVQLIVGSGEEIQLRAFGIGDGVDAAFTIGKTTAFSWRLRSK